MYFALFNLVDHPSVAIPRLHVVTSDDTNPKDYNDAKYGDDLITKAIRKSLIGSEGLPMGIQVSTLSHQDEKCLGVAKNIDDVFKKHKVQKEVVLQDL